MAFEYEIASLRNTLWGFPIYSETSAGYGDCEIFAQWDPRWGNIQLGYGGGTSLANIGCLVTSIAIGMSCSGTELTVSNFDPGVLATHLVSNGCFTNGSGTIKYREQLKKNV